jgi:hypothetical protein
MYQDLNIKSKKAQGVKIAYLPNPNRLHFPLLGITRIDAQWIALFYLSAWDLLPGRYDPKKSKSANRQAITKLRKKFNAIAHASGVKVARKVCVTQLLLSIQKLGVVNLLGYEKAESLLAALHYLQFAGGEK